MWVTTSQRLGFLSSNFFVMNLNGANRALIARGLSFQSRTIANGEVDQAGGGG